VGWRFGVPLLLSIGLPAALGFALRGAPVLRFMGIDVVRKDGRPASRVRCAWRNLVVWAPIMIMSSFFSLLMIMSSMFEGESGDPPTTTMIVLGLFSCSVPLLCLLVVLGTIYALVHPQRGLQDLIADTCIVPR